MEYTLRANILYANEKATARIKGSFTGPEKRILSPEGELLLQTDIFWDEAHSDGNGDLSFCRYIMTDPEGNETAKGEPRYAGGEEPGNAGWPVCRMPRTDRAEVTMDGKKYTLYMKDGRNYVLKNGSGEDTVTVTHRGMAGGWNIWAEDGIKPETVCGIYVFCRYIEQENELPMV